MLIVPKSLVSAFALDTKVLDWDSKELSQICEQSFIQKSKSMLASYWLSVWKKGNSTLPQSGRILKPYHVNSFLKKWTSSQGDILVNHSHMRGKEKGKKIHGTCGLGLQKLLKRLNRKSASLKMFLDMSRWDSPQSLAIWKNWAMKQTGDYFQRKKLEHRIREKESLSWPTPTVPGGIGTMGDWGGSGNQLRKWPTPTLQEDPHPNAKLTKTGRRKPVKGKTSHSMNLIDTVIRNWPTPTTMDILPARPAIELAKQNRIRGGRKNRMVLGNLREAIHSPIYGQVVRESLKKNGRNPELFPQQNQQKRRSLHPKNWSKEEWEESLNDMQMDPNAKLNPDWVEQLMGLPVGWTQIE